MKITEVGPVPQTKTPKETSEIAGDLWTISLPKTRIHTLEQLIEHCKIDLAVWEVERFICNKWDVGMSQPKVAEYVNGKPIWVRTKTNPVIVELYQVKAFLRRKTVIVAALGELNELRKKAEKFSPKYPTLAKQGKGTETLAEFSINDHHFGALIWGKETGGEDYDLKIAKTCWENALSALVSRTEGYRPDKALLVLGNDQQNADNRIGTTERGTPQNMDGRYQKVFSVSRDCSIWAIDALLGQYKSVDVVLVAGNHDPLSAWHLGDSLKSWYRNCNAVNVNNEPSFRKYYEFGTNMLLFTHGHAGKIEDYGKTMAAEQPAMWGRTKWREAHTGDKHHKRTIEFPGVTIRILPSLRPPDAWSSEYNYVGSIRSAEAYVWNKTEGLIGTSVYSILSKIG
jgi:hypothetical protein